MTHHYIKEHRDYTGVTFADIRTHRSSCRARSPFQRLVYFSQQPSLPPNESNSELQQYTSRGADRDAPENGFLKLLECTSEPCSESAKVASLAHVDVAAADINLDVAHSQ